MDDRQRRIGENEALFREVNERVRETSETFDVARGEAQFVCECGTAACVERVHMRLDEYERVRADPTTFLIVPGHDQPDVEVVVAHEGNYAIVRKNTGAAEEIAIHTDPRS
jgi:hypothetical protein